MRWPNADGGTISSTVTLKRVIFFTSSQAPHILDGVDCGIGIRTSFTRISRSLIPNAIQRFETVLQSTNKSPLMCETGLTPSLAGSTIVIADVVLADLRTLPKNLYPTVATPILQCDEGETRRSRNSLPTFYFFDVLMALNIDTS